MIEVYQEQLLDLQKIVPAFKISNAVVHFDEKSKTNLTEDMKDTDMLYWVGTMNSIKAKAEEIVLKELIYIGDDANEEFKRSKR